MHSLSKRFGKFQAVDNLNISIYKDEIMCILGHNGAGKTTTINMLTGMLTPSSGDAEVLGYSLLADINDVR
jgi:ABC-type multidrug transport system ATPase subunit